MIFWPCSPVTLPSLMVQHIAGPRRFGRGRNERPLGCTCRSTWYERRIREGTVVEFDATSKGGYSGPGTFAFTIRGTRITRLEIR